MSKGTTILALRTFVITAMLFGNLPIALAFTVPTRTIEATVQLYLAEPGTTKIIGKASGVIVSSNGLVVTAKHAALFDEINKLSFDIIVVPTDKDGNTIFDCGWVAGDVSFLVQQDIAFLAPPKVLPCKSVAFMPLANSLPILGQDIQILGYPGIAVGGSSLTATRGQIAGKIKDKNGQNMFYKTDAKIITGVSGGPVINDKGELIAIAVAYTFAQNELGLQDLGQEDIGLIVPVQNFAEYFPSLISGTSHSSNPTPSDEAPSALPPKQTELVLTPLQIKKDLQERIKKNLNVQPRASTQEPEKLFSDQYGAEGCNGQKYIENFNDLPNSGQKMTDPYTDIRGGDLACQLSASLRFLKKGNIMVGYSDGSFKGMNTINRAEFTKIVVRSFYPTEDLSKYKNCFPDVAEQWFANYVCFAKDKGWIEGYKDGLFKPDAPVSNVEALKILIEPNYKIELSDTTATYPKINSGDWFAKYLITALNLRIVDGNWQGLSFDPSESIKRADIAMVLYKFIKVDRNKWEKYDSRLDDDYAPNASETDKSNEIFSSEGSIACEGNGTFQDCKCPSGYTPIVIDLKSETQRCMLWE